MGLKHFKCQDCQTADFFCFEKGVNFNVKVLFLIIVALILGLVLAGYSLPSNVGQVPTNE